MAIECVSIWYHIETHSIAMECVYTLINYQMRFNMVPPLGIELSSQAYKTRASPFMLWGRIFDICPNSRRYRWLPTQEYALRNLAQKLQFLKQQEQSRRTLNSYNHYIVQASTSKLKKLVINQLLKKVAVFGAGGKIHRHLGTQVLPQEDEGVAKHGWELLGHI